MQTGKMVYTNNNNYTITFFIENPILLYILNKE